MFIIDIVNFLSNYSRDAIIVSLIVAILTTIIDKFLTQKQKTSIKILTPFVLGIMVYFLFNVFCYGIVSLSLDIVYAGLLCGSLSSSIYMICYKLIRGEINFDFKTLPIEGIIKDYVNKEFITEILIDIKKVFNEKLGQNESVDKIFDILNKNKLDVITESEIKIVSSLLYESYKNLDL